MDGSARTLYDPRPCSLRDCGGRVVRGSGLCESCGAKFLRPQPGPQTDFLACDATILLYGGAAGGGKTWSLLIDWLRHSGTPGANGLIVRNRQTDITIGGGLWDEAKLVFAGTGAVFRGGAMMDVTWPSGAKLSFRHLDDKNVERFKGPGFSWIGIEEADECPLSAIIYLLSRLRSTCGARPVLRMTCNPNPDHPLAIWVAPYLSKDGTADRSKSGMTLYIARSTVTDAFVFGTTPEDAASKANADVSVVMSFAFIPSLLEDNPALDLADPNYRAKIAMQGQTKSQQLGKGNWLVREQVHGMLPTGRFGWVTAPLAPIVRMVRAWDKGAREPRDTYPDPDFTVGILMGWDVYGRWYVLDMVVCREESPQVDQLLAATASMDGPGVTQVIEIEPGAAGIRDDLQTQKVLRSGGNCGPITSVAATKNKVAKARSMANELRLGMNGNVPRVIDMVEGEDGVWAPRGFVIIKTWMEIRYQDKGEHPPTRGALFLKQINPFFDPKEHDDIPDAMAIAHNAGSVAVVMVEDPILRALRLG